MKHYHISQPAPGEYRLKYKYLMNTESVPVIKRIAISYFRFLSWWQAGDDFKRMCASQWTNSLEPIRCHALSILLSCLVLQ